MPKISTFLILPVILALLGGCDAMDSLLTSAGTYKISASVNDIPLDECSFIHFNDKIIPYFEEDVSKDPDITSLIIFIKDSSDEILDWTVIYTLENETEKYDSPVSINNLDNDLPFFKLPEDLPKGFYTLVFQINGGKDILQRIEREFYYLNNTVFSYNGIDVHLPGISDNPYLVSKGQIVMLELKLKFDDSLDPYIIWYNGKSKIAEGTFSEGYDKLFWKAPEMSNFYSLRAEVFPVKGVKNIAGYQKEVSILVSSKTVDINLVSEDVPELVNWYIFESNLNDSKTPVPVDFRSIQPEGDIDINWLSSNGTYGLATGYENIFTLPKNSLAESDSWQVLFRFRALNTGNILTINFGNNNARLTVNINDGFIELTLDSGFKKVSRVNPLNIDKESFNTLGINFFTEPYLIGASVNVFGETLYEGDNAPEPVLLDLEIESLNSFQIILGQLYKEEFLYEPLKIEPVTEITDNDEQDLLNENPDNEKEVVEEQVIIEGNTFNAYLNVIWDEIALYNKPSMDIIAEDIIQASNASDSE